MEESERERELIRMLSKGAIDKKGYDERRRQYIEDLGREKKIDAYRRLEMILRWMCCCPCANLCFKDEGDKWKRRFCASSLICLLSGGITTLLSSGVIPRFSSSCLGLKIGIPVSVLGCLCSTVLCACKSEKCPCSRKKKQCETSSTSSLGRVVNTQPRPKCSHCSDDDENYAEDDSPLLSTPACRPEQF